MIPGVSWLVGVPPVLAAVRQPVRLVVPEGMAPPEASGHDLLPVVAGALVVAVLAGAGAFLVWWRWLRVKDPVEVAFRKLARWNGLSPGARTLLRTLASGNAPPVSLVVSAHALAHAVDRFERSGPSLADRLALAELKRVLLPAGSDAPR